ncbi:hypothetical protein AVEN_257772-1 [Araneus ventricosus]|uniref:Uncharacterized protein n=1 Tax=Araneus ventricosus TaxID=182803 RepID=A0A4Y2KDI4_ARAVE|nr:hypothetical protein AVEN_257772-1 [Araneus ventricosus]
MIQFSLRHSRPPESGGRHFTGRKKRTLRPYLVVCVELLDGRDALAVLDALGLFAGMDALSLFAGMDALGLFVGMDELDLREDTDAPGSLKPKTGFSLLMEIQMGLS